MNDLALLTGMIGRGGVVMWIIAGLSVLTLALILWKLWRLSLSGLWRRIQAERAVALWVAGQAGDAQAMLVAPRGIRSRVVAQAMAALRDPSLTRDAARDEVLRVARRELNAARSGLRALELISTIAPLLGLLGTVLGMITAFQALQSTGAQADPTILAGGIWEALLTTAAGMAVAIPAGVALVWIESLTDGVQADLEDAVTQIFTRDPAGGGA
ncbi:MotA/TolQ/ExbB proton channel family protein [Seohaeicola sp. SP36]|uniref:MotA/TolQ/ExbB proton channel family protein n=1 Tax=unclassified Seohaeicola TaxID=2641111 RepID=UPI00237A719B|nr:MULTISPECIES: MotA/TolQ/ExbB proton channel family protein [unclassified Seohaeicola]MDD9706717.1 MotA/TolQ/ExbB proton channel family protein [Seohaeicola sp. 4SK31]MDD9734423.1 MotA/TolQ/ExbB proton channel family protein [Seohaeicola sp. SP36]